MLRLHPAMLAIVAALFLANLETSRADISRPGGSGHALLFRDHGIKIENFNDLGTDEFTFEAWVRTSDYCHRSALFSYALPSTAVDERQRTADFNHLVLFDPSRLVLCHDFEYIDLWPDPNGISCYAAFNDSSAIPSIVTRDASWNHVTVTWTSANNGLTKIYVNGLLRVQTPTGKTAPIRPGGALMLGAEQDCYGGCLDAGQGFNGEMDEVRIWRTARSQADILAHMRDASGVDSHPDLALYLHFNDPEEVGLLRSASVARDSSGRGNDLHLMTLPQASMQHIQGPSGGGAALDAGAMTFRNNYAMNQGFDGMPESDITVEFWARTPAINTTTKLDNWNEFFSFASIISGTGGSGEAAAAFLDDAILIEKYAQEFKGTSWVEYKDISTTGSISVHINANRQGMAQANDHWIDFNVGWVDNLFHHVAVTWRQQTGEVFLYFDGVSATPYWVSNAGAVEVKEPSAGGVDRRIATNGATAARRSPRGSLAVGSKQENYGGMFSPEFSMHGEMANLRIWDRVLTQSEVSAGMFTSDPPNKTGLMFSYSFDPANVQSNPAAGTGIVKDTFSSYTNDLYLGADAPQWVYSSAPMALSDGSPVPRPTPGAAGYALRLNDQQVLIHKDFTDFPSDEITLEFWMLTTDSCREGVPFSYATGGEYAVNDNSFLLFDYKSWGIAVMNDEGLLGDHKSGIGANDGRWKHIAVTWRSSDGQTKLYHNGREVWSVIRGVGKHIPSGGTLVVGREQDCAGGCFDSDPGAAGDVSPTSAQEYASQDFFGLIDEMRVWRRVRTVEEISGGMRASLSTKGRTGRAGSDAGIDPRDPDLVAYWNFDEGQGYTIRDITGRGHNLFATQRTRWEVVRWLAACGNGVLEAGEECDTGDNKDGDGCSSECKVEPGWECTATSPSACWRQGAPPPLPPGPAPGPGGGGGDAPPAPPSPPSGKGKKGHSIVRSLFSTLGSLAVVGVLAGVVYTQRQAIYERFPVVEDGIAAGRERVAHYIGVLKARLGFGGGGYSSYGGGDGLEVEHGDMASPDFTRVIPERSGGYAPLPAHAPQGP